MSYKHCTPDSEDCPRSATCVEGTCECYGGNCCFNDDDCFSTQKCAGLGRCECKDDESNCCVDSCFRGSCRDGICYPNEEGSACVRIRDCPDGLRCIDQVCKKYHGSSVSDFKDYSWVIGYMILPLLVFALVIALIFLIWYCIIKHASKRRPRMNQLNPVQLNQNQQPDSAPFYPPPVGTQGYPMTATASYPTAPPPISAPVGTPGYPPYPPPPPVTSV